MPGKDCFGQDQPTAGNSNNADTSRAGREAAAIAAAAQTRTRLVENALRATLTEVLGTVPLSDGARERIAELIRLGGGNEP
jgi:hypothetical protein